MHYQETDPSDYTAEEAEQIARQELLSKQDSDATDRSLYWKKRGYDAPISLAQLREADLELDFLVKDCLVKGQPCTISGASKGMKTTLSIHLTLALASGVPFLGQFNVRERQRVLFASAESGAATIRRNLIGMADAMDVDVDELDGQLAFQWWVPKAGNTDLVEHFLAGVEEHRATVVVMDPLYLMLGGENQSNLSGQGEEIMTLMNQLIDMGVTPVVDDHVKRSSENARNFKPIQLEDITGAGKAECFRQWMLLGRRSRFEADSDSTEHLHDLWATIGGSAGFSRTWGLDISESLSDDFSEVEYSLSMRKASEVREEQKDATVVAAENRQQRKEQVAASILASKCEKVLAEMKRKPDTLFTRTDIRSIAAVSGQKANEIIYELERQKNISQHPEGIKRGNNLREAWQIPGTANMDLTDSPPNIGQEWQP